MDYCQYDENHEITERISGLKEKRRLLRPEMQLLENKERQAQWYRKRKRESMEMSPSLDDVDDQLLLSSCDPSEVSPSPGCPQSLFNDYTSCIDVDRSDSFNNPDFLKGLSSPIQ